MSTGFLLPGGSQVIETLEDKLSLAVKINLHVSLPPKMRG